MAITFYYGAGSPFAWRVWLALEHKGIGHERKVLSFADGDTRKPEFVALNPRHQVPVITDGDFTLYESAAIMEYLEELKPQPALFPGDAKGRAVVRRMICEADQYFDAANAKLIGNVLFTKPEDWDAEKIAAARDGVLAEVAMWEPAMRGDFLAGTLSAADFTLYPMLAIALRCEAKNPAVGLRAALPPKIAAWAARIEKLPYFAKTWPAHWK